MKRVADIVKSFFESKGVEHVFLLSGGMMMHLLDAISKSEQIRYICNHHEQACAIAAEAYARVKGEAGLCYATSGPGATNTLTGIAGAWLDSVPVIIITGQSRTTLTVRGTGNKGLRMLGTFEVDIVELSESLTKYSACVDKPADILYHLEKAFHNATTGRPGPVLLDIPLDVQGAMIEETSLRHFEPPQPEKYNAEIIFADLLKRLKTSKKPLLLAGHGIRVAGEVEHFKRVIERLNIPVATTQLANDLLPYEHPLYIGKVGLRGDRAGNFAVQSADLIITLGSSLHITTTGYETDQFAPQAYKMAIDIDAAVLKKNKEFTQAQIQADVATTLTAFEGVTEPLTTETKPWIQKLLKWKKMFPISGEPHPKENNEINTYLLIDQLSDALGGDEIIVTDAGSLYYVVGQAFKVKGRQRVIVSGALGAMGYALPASIGAALAAPDRPVICLTGDGSMQTNVQELQTISTYNLNCKIIVINNKGYASIRNSQAAFLDGHIAAASEDTNVTFPDWQKLADAYSIPYIREDKFDQLPGFFHTLMQSKGPVFAEIVIPEKVTLIPAVTSERLPNGSFKSNRLHEMSPALTEEVKANAEIDIQY